MKFSSLRRLLTAGLALLALTAGSGAHAAFRHYLSSTGSDANPCTLVAPCRLLPRALAVVDPGGEIWMLNSANYSTGLVSIDKSVTILAVPGQVGSVVGNNDDAIWIAAAGIEVTLQNLNILSLSNSGRAGVRVFDAGKVSIVNCNIFGFRGLNNGAANDGVGVWVDSGANAPQVNIVGSTVRNNSLGIVVAGNGRAHISRTHVLSNAGYGIIVRSMTGNAIVHVSDSISSSNSHGYAASGCDTTCTSQMFVTRSVASENVVDGFLTEGGTNTFMTVEDSMATHNIVGFHNVQGTFQSRGNNTVIGNANGDNSVGTITTQTAL